MANHLFIKNSMFFVLILSTVVGLALLFPWLADAQGLAAHRNAPAVGTCYATHDNGVTVFGSGRVTSAPSGIDCGDDCSSLFVNGITVTLTAAADSGSKFTGWSNDYTSSETCVVKMDRSRKVSANFDLLLQKVFKPLIFRW